MREDDAFFDKALEGFALFALNQGEVCTCPSRVLVQESIYEKFMERAVARVNAIKQGSPFDPDTMIGAQASKEQLDKILSYIDIGRQEGAQVLTGGAQAQLGGDLEGGFYVQPTILAGHNKMRVFQEEIFGPVVAVTTFRTRKKPWRWPTTPASVWALACGPVMAPWPIAWAVASRPAVCGPTATTCTRLTRLRWLQEIRHRPRNPQDDAGPLPANQELVGELQPERPGLLPSATHKTPGVVV